MAYERKNCRFSDGTPVKKWHRVLIAHAKHWGLTEKQARRIIEINPYLKKHKSDFDAVFNERYMNYFTPQAQQNEMALADYEKWIAEAKDNK